MVKGLSKVLTRLKPIFMEKIDDEMVDEYMLKTNLKLLFLLFLVRIRRGEKQATENYFKSCMKHRSNT